MIKMQCQSEIHIEHNVSADSSGDSSEFTNEHKKRGPTPKMQAGAWTSWTDSLTQYVLFVLHCPGELFPSFSHVLCRQWARVFFYVTRF